MDHCNRWFLLLIVLHLQYWHSWGWFFSSKESHSSEEIVAEFSMEPTINNQKGTKLLENDKRMAVSSNSCWQNACQKMFAGCSEILAGEEKRSRVAWHLSDCFQEGTGSPPFPHCGVKSNMMTCLKNLDEEARDIYLEFYVETNSVCHQLQADTFKRQMERLVNELTNLAENAEFKIENILGRADDLLESSNKIQDSWASIDLGTRQLAQTSKNLEEHANIVLKHSESVYEQSIGIAYSQSELIEGQTNMKGNLVEGMTMLHDSCDNLGVEIDNLKYEAIEIENEIGRMGDEMSLKTKSLQSKADDIGNISGR